MAIQGIQIRISVAWWLRWYLAGVALMCRVSGADPDVDRVVYWVRRSIRMRIE